MADQGGRILQSIDTNPTYPDALRSMAAGKERRALLAQELEGCATVIECLCGLIAKVEAERDEARAFIGRNVHCTCLPYAQPGDGTMCQRCEFLREVEQ